MLIEDVVYGTIDIPADIAKIISTPQMVRLKSVKQLGLLNFIHANAITTRLEHCIGTYHAACKMLDSLELNSNIVIPTLFRHVVQIGAILHDVGHGPFSHCWETIGNNFHHEENSIPCVDAIFEQLGEHFMPALRENNNYGIELIKAIIMGDPTRVLKPSHRMFGFIFEIVNNKQCKVDVDKWDYLKRDYTQLKYFCDPNMDFDDVFLKARVSENGEHVIYRYEDYHKIYAIFEARWCFHVNCYRIPKAVVCDEILRIIVRRLPNKICGKMLTEINAWHMTAFLELTDFKVLELAQQDQYYKYLEDINDLKIDYNSGSKNYVLYVEEFIKGPGIEMPPDECFFFYGNPSKKLTIQRNNKTTQRSGYLPFEQ